jgi:hypothetical protein
MDQNNKLVLLSLDLVIPNLWENKLARAFPEVSFVVCDAYPSGCDSFLGLMKIENGNLLKIKNYIENNFPGVCLESFSGEQGVFCYSESNFFLSDVLSKVSGILTWPVEFNESYKKLKIVLKRRYVNDFINSVEEKGINVSNFSIVNVDFNVNDFLTSKQREIFVASLMFGYYKFPKEISLNKLAEKISLSPSTLCVHLQKIESKFFNSLSQDFFLRRRVMWN